MPPRKIAMQRQERRQERRTDRRDARQAAAPQRDYFAELNAFVDPNIGGQQPGPIQAGYGGFGALDTLMGTKMNNFLNQFAVGGDRERAMNALGYNNQGNPYTPQVAPGTNRYYRQQAKANQQTGGYSAPGVYQHQDDAGNYIGITNVLDDLSARYTPFDINRGQGGGQGRMKNPTFRTDTAPRFGGPRFRAPGFGRITGSRVGGIPGRRWNGIGQRPLGLRETLFGGL